MQKTFENTKWEFFLRKEIISQLNYYVTFSRSTGFDHPLRIWILKMNFIWYNDSIFIHCIQVTFYYILFKFSFILFYFLSIKVFSSHGTSTINNLLDPVPYGYGSIFCYWHFQHISLRSTKDKINPKNKYFLC